MPIPQLPFTLTLALLGSPPASPPDEGYDLLLLDVPHRAVMGDLLKFSVRGRPGNPYLVLIDVGRTAQPEEEVGFVDLLDSNLSHAHSAPLDRY